jgi:hypothetical protein
MAFQSVIINEITVINSRHEWKKVKCLLSLYVESLTMPVFFSKKCDIISHIFPRVYINGNEVKK